MMRMACVKFNITKDKFEDEVDHEMVQSYLLWLIRTVLNIFLWLQMVHGLPTREIYPHSLSRLWRHKLKRDTQFGLLGIKLSNFSILINFITVK